MRILVAEPEELLLKVYLEVLHRKGFVAQGAATGPECVAKLESWKPDVLVLEVDMPDGWGEKILSVVETQPDGRRTRVIILSRLNQTELDHRVTGFFVKPYSMAALAKSIWAMDGPRRH